MFVVVVKKNVCDKYIANLYGKHKFVVIVVDLASPPVLVVVVHTHLAAVHVLAVVDLILKLHLSLASRWCKKNNI
jgi:hypothetical protein